jgi:NAD(P)-dependent dehydrogenase (short-subunit alcohol dehydrogenase family)
MDLRGKRALVTGGAVRIGRVICEALAARGCSVVVHCRQSVAEGEALAARLSDAGAPSFCVQGSLGSETEAEQVVAAAVTTAGGLDILVNNASTFNKDVFMAADAARIEAEIGINAFAPMYLARAFARHILTRPASVDALGKIVNLLDRRVAGLEKGMLPYLLSKKLLAEYTRLAALELGPRITVNAVAPGPVLPPPGRGEDYLHDHAGPMVLGRRPSPADVATAVLYLLAADTVTGQILYVDSGQHLL